MPLVSQIDLALASRSRSEDKACVHGPALADAMLVAAWGLLLLDLFRMAARAGVSPLRRLLGLLLLALILVAGGILEAATGGRRGWHPLVAALGVAAAWAGLALHAWARRTLARGWTPIVAPPADAVLVQDGPYAWVRHPLYAAILLLALGTVAAHYSRATLMATVGFGIGILLKGRAEDRALEQRFGERWRAYAARVRGFVPRLTSGRP
jgi:protein-S-isoprenylcysteine O-methyltransferase Ste14